MNKIIIVSTIIISICFLFIYNNSIKAGTTVGQCSYEISMAIGTGNCDTVGDCWYNIAKKIVGNPSCGSVGCTTCDVAEKIASKELKKYNGLTVGNCSAAIADHLNVESGSWADSVCGISEKVQKTKILK